MYAQHFGLSAEPFSLTPDPAFLYLSPEHSEALAAIEVGIRGGRGLIVMTGEVGTGKTTVLYSILSRLGPDVRTAYISNTSFSFEEMLAHALADFGVVFPGASKLELINALNAFLMQCAADRVAAVLVIDEAQNLDDEGFENLRLLSNYETFRDKLLQIVLVGQPELEVKLRNPRLRQVADRIAVHCHVNPLTRSESRRYLEHRLESIGGSLDVFTPGALRVLLRAARGNPRRINILCHNAMLFAYGHGERRVPRSLAVKAVREREGRGLVSYRPVEPAAMSWRGPWLRPALIAAGLVLATLGVVAAARWQDAPPRQGMTMALSNVPADRAGSTAPARSFSTTLSVETSFAGRSIAGEIARPKQTYLTLETRFGAAAQAQP